MYKALVVDDEQRVLNMIVRQCKKSGITVVPKTNAKEALS
jgi:CheY-like chemotaxis protein